MRLEGADVNWILNQ